MTLSAADLEELLTVVATAAAGRRELPSALRESGAPGALALAAALEGGEDLPTALAGLAPPALLDLFAAGRLPLESTALLGAAWLRRQAERRVRLLAALAYPLLSALLVLVAVLAVGWGTLARPAPGFLALAALPLGLMALQAWAAWAGRELPLAGAWVRHERLAERYARLALAARWRLTEDEARRLLGCTVLPSALVAAPDADALLELLAEHHVAAAGRSARLAAALSAALVLLAVAALVLASGVGVWRWYLGVL